MSSDDAQSCEGEIFFTLPSLEELRLSICDERAPIAKRMRSCFLLKQVGGAAAVEALSPGLYSASTLLGHEVAYVLGQMREPSAAPLLTRCLQDCAAHPIVRHECAEALANIDLDESLPLLRSMTSDPCTEVSDTAAIAVERMAQRRMAAAGGTREVAEESVDAAVAARFASVDPAPPLPSRDVATLRSVLCDPALSLYVRYRAMFALRNVASEEAIDALSASLTSSQSPVFRHEVAYVLGQIAHPAALHCLRALLADRTEHAMVRHEAAEAIGSIAEDDSAAALEPYLKDATEDVIVQESCHVALDLAEYWNSDEVSTALSQDEDAQQQP